MTATDAQHAIAWQVQSLLISYPDEQLVDRGRRCPSRSAHR
jgi:nitrate reductase assembly molybdenum cofactor insertion protein NarJ